MAPQCERDGRFGRPGPGRHDTLSPPPREPDLHLELAADWVSPSLARDRVGRWLRRLDWPADDRDDVVYVVSEAVSNSVEHGYGVRSGGGPHLGAPGGGTVRVDGWVVVGGSGEGGPGGSDEPVRHVELVVADAGTWRPPTGGAGRTRGLVLMRALMAELAVRHGPGGGTAVLLRGHPVTARAPEPG